MTFESDLYSLLSSSSGLTNLVGDRIVPSHRIEGVGTPYLVYTVVQQTPFYYMESGAGNMSRVLLQVDGYAEDPDTAALIALAVVAAIPQTGALHRADHTNRDLGMEEDTRLFRRMVEFSLFHRTS